MDSLEANTLHGSERLLGLLAELPHENLQEISREN